MLRCDREHGDDCEYCDEQERKEKEAAKCKCSPLAHCRCGRRDWVVHQYGR